MFVFHTLADSRLVKQTLGGDAGAFGELVERYSGAVFGVVFAHLRNRADAEDISQDVFLTAYKSLDTLLEPAKFGRWLTTMAKNRCRDALKRRRVEMTSPGRLIAAPVNTRPHPEREELYRLLHEEMANLDADDREVLMLHYFSRKKTREMGQLLGISQTAAAKRLQRARAALGERLVAVIGEELSREDKPSERAARIMRAVMTAPAAWKSVGTSVAAVGSHMGGAGMMGGGMLLMKKVLIGILLVLAVLTTGHIALRHALQRNTLSLDVPQEVGVKTPPAPLHTHAVTPEEQPENTSPAVSPNELKVQDGDVLNETAALEHCEIAYPSCYCSISGRVLDRDGDPIAGANVLAACQGFEQGGGRCPRRYE
ncbi:MAG TPA: sigma-70 family RNA polymerase sigma factor [Candidatus Hydrogenedentes bacterium]|nr:sigma-70 family RNA polymerase sigma factor [Candidatus Hydrogenedentota bacterium]